MIEILGQLNEISGSVEDERSPSALIGKLTNALQFLTSNPANEQSARSAITVARSVTNCLNAASQAVASIRGQVEDELAAGVVNSNRLLSEIENVNQKIVCNSQREIDVTDFLDERDRLVETLAEEIGLRVSYRQNSDIVLQTDSGIILFETVARKLFYQAGAPEAGAYKNSVVIDGILAIGSNSPMAISTGRLKALTDLRDSYCTSASAQIDEISRGLISAFAEKSTNLGATSQKAGLFLSQVSDEVPDGGALRNGLAQLISINPAYDPTAGGNAFLLRDSGSAGPSFKANVDGYSGYTARLDELLGAVDAQREFSSSASLGVGQTLPGFAAAAIAWLSQSRQTATSEWDYLTAVRARASDALQMETGISLDSEMSHMLDLERSYQASAKLISTIDQIYDVLIKTLG
jgi:flagellar hook-associated protein 1 FlgK